MKILAWIGSHVAAVLVAGGLIYLAITAAHERELRKQAEAAAQKLQTEVAKQQGFQAVTPTSAGRTEAALSPEAKAELAAIRKTVRDTSVAVHALTEASLSSSSAGHLIPATPTMPATCEDAFNRFRVSTADCRFDVRQKFRLEATVLRGIDGKTRFFKERLVELDPVTSVPIPGEPPQLTSSVQITEEAAPERVFGLKVLGGVDERFAPGAGLQFAEKWRLSARALGFYSPKDRDLRGLIGMGWRPKIPFFDSRVSLGGGIGLSTKTPGAIFGAHLTAELGTITR